MNKSVWVYGTRKAEDCGKWQLVFRRGESWVVYETRMKAKWGPVSLELVDIQDV